MTAPRNDHPGAWHHLMNRGARRETIFHRAGDARRFLELVGELSGRHGVEVHAYCLMPNHFHLLVRSVDGRVPAFMQQLSSTYTREINRRLGHDGAMFRGRYRSKLIDTDSYLLTAVRYIHRNPIGLRPAVALDRFRWSSYGAYAGTIDAEPWLHRDEILAWFPDIDVLRTDIEGAGRVPSPSDLATIAEFALDEQFFDLDVVRLVRPLLLAVVDQLGPDIEIDSLGFPTGGARRTAASRARARLRSDAALAAALERVLDVAA